ncbi:MAG: 2Fe-2S iron-sulfur cluster-binding protein [Hyphomicrobiaceae bacterium]
MSQSISLSRLARLVGLPRSTLQRMAQAGEFATFDGHVELAEVMRAFPGARFDNDSEIRRVEEIKNDALNKSAERPELPDAAVLMGRLQQMGRDYAGLAARVRHYALVHRWLVEKVKDLTADGKIEPVVGDGLLRWFKHELEATPREDARWQQLVTQERLMRVMSAQVTVLPRGTTFEAQGNETLLDAGLRAGLSFAYGCSNGNCGDCKARVIEGEVLKVRPHDFALNEAQKAKGITLMCSYAAVGDVVLEAAMAGTRDIPQQTIMARVRAIEPLGKHVTAVHLLTPRSDRLQFLAGQRLRVTIGGQAAEVSIASCPCEERRIEVHVRETDTWSPFASAGLKQNDEVEIVGPFGEFVLNEASARPLVLIAQGEGYAPIKSLVQHALSLDLAPNIALYWLADAGGHYQENLPRSYAAALDNFDYIPLTINGDHKAALAAILARPDLVSSDVYAAGDAAFIETMRSAWLTAGLSRDNLRVEAFGSIPD